MRRTILMAFAVVCGASAMADVMVPTGATYQYIDATAGTTYGGSTAGWETSGYDDSGWSTGAAIFGNSTGIDSNPNVTQWDAGYDPKLRLTFTLSSAFDNIKGMVAVDNGYDVWLDGVYISGANAEGYTWYWEYSFDMPDLAAGTHTLAFQLEDHGGLTAFDFQMEGNLVPEPGALGALGIGALAMLRRRTR